MEQLVRQIAPEMPKDYHVQSTPDMMAWYRINSTTKTLAVPPLNVLKKNILELERFSEAVKSFETTQLDTPMYCWDDESLELSQCSDPNSMVAYLKNIPALATEGILACDIETRNLSWNDNRVLSIGFAYSPSACAAVYNIDFDNDEIHDALEWVFSRPGIKYVWHNGKFDIGKLEWLHDIHARVDEDTLLQHYVQINEKQGTHGLKALGSLYLQAPAWDDELDDIKRTWCRTHKIPLKSFTYDCLPISTLIPYMQRDCIATYRLFQRFKKLARPESEFIYKQLCRASNVFKDIELAGQQIDVEYLDELEKDLNAKILTAKRHLAKYGNFNPNSPKQLAEKLQEVLHTHVSSTNALTLETLQNNPVLVKTQEQADFIQGIMDLRKYTKYLSTYVVAIRNELCDDNRVRSTFNLHGTETGRLSSKDPNAQNFPRNKYIKNLIVSAPGHILVQLDYSQAELRCLAMMSKAPALVQIYKDGKDLHDMVADMMFGEGAHQDKELRTMAKTISFGVVYGRGASNIAETFHRSMGEAKRIIDKWFDALPGVREYINARRMDAKRGAPCETLFGRNRHFILTNENMNHIQNEYINTPIQSIASDFTLLSLMNIYDYLQENWKGVAQIISTVHDSIMLEVEDNPIYVKEITEKCLQIMAETPLQYVPDCEVPFVADADSGYKWGELS